ncbi:hypothetical protein TWF569_002255 [Orbilia oligospora]|uniref:Uncharacterized protein n=1 Tax=Orbilia oligospora TaxID=2813651 RepID=A0A7C8MZX4_ORBOL|nr:hypothetical protein TWF706_002324 [Orbilia oligospora]KAF3088352.1 hypothetical protein TWF102_010250 [Orbilia oligospora]KAF3095099.1 hypothetical protein TWF103_010381 [Orbilia oligospora]KAF3122172.1 hypothetical protein TWF569_002255 [Orbilia oligospora]KAF3130330.1 hypothetical protein TWF594_010393 [Orbilia oligospora]
MSLGRWSQTQRHVSSHHRSSVHQTLRGRGQTGSTGCCRNILVVACTIEAQWSEGEEEKSARALDAHRFKATIPPLQEERSGFVPTHVMVLVCRRAQSGQFVTIRTKLVVLLRKALFEAS